MKFYPHHIGDYRSATAYLSNEEDICYRRLLEIYYDTERPIIPDTRLLSRQTRVSQAVVEDILQEFFTLIDGFWHNGRADGEISRWYSKSAAAKANIEKRWEKKKNDTDVLRTNNKRNTKTYEHDTTQDPRPNKKELTLFFNEFWDAYGKKVGKPNALKEWNKISPSDDEAKEIISAANSLRLSRPDPTYRKDPERWLKARGWEDELTTVQSVKSDSLTEIFARAI